MTNKALTPSDAGAPNASPLKRRGLLLGAAAAGAAVVAAKALPGGAAAEVVEAAAKPALDTAGGYQLTPHVLRYYETTKV
ncbi:MAG TPA: formate dehydrogenase [Albitalea sp.]|nr:formate dehydrogenase [Albitalea sp.]